MRARELHDKKPSLREGTHIKLILLVDAAKHSREDKHAVLVVDVHGTLISTASVCMKHIQVAEETTITLALHATKGPMNVYSTTL